MKMPLSKFLVSAMLWSFAIGILAFLTITARPILSTSWLDRALPFVAILCFLAAKFINPSGFDPDRHTKKSLAIQLSPWILVAVVAYFVFIYLGVDEIGRKYVLLFAAGAYWGWGVSVAWNRLQAKNRRLSDDAD